MKPFEVMSYLFWIWIAIIHIDEWWIKRAVRKREKAIIDAHNEGALPVDHSFYSFDNDPNLRKAIINGLLRDVTELKEKIKIIEIEAKNQKTNRHS